MFKLFSKRQVGYDAESLACSHLRKLGYKILNRNFTIRGGEIDIIAKDKDTLVFIEVKARYSNSFGTALESITYWKLKSLQKTALFYIQKIRWGDRPYRFDLVAIDHKDKIPQIEHIKEISL